MNQLAKITLLAQYLPEEDVQYAEKFISSRDFESLLELVDSDIFRVRRDRNRSIDLQKFSTIDLDRLITLKAEVSSYLMLINGDDYDEY